MRRRSGLLGLALALAALLGATPLSTVSQAQADEAGASTVIEVREGRRDEQREWRRNWQRDRRGDWRHDRRHWRRHHDHRGRQIYVVPYGYGYPYGYAPYGYYARPGVTFQFGL
jgi:hypothetical protein